MKLIDEDKLKTNLWDLYCHYACNGHDLNRAGALNVCLGAVEVQEEIEAIPISWLINWEKEHTQEYETYFREIGRYPIECVVEDWRKEKENNNVYFKSRTQ